MPEVRHLTDLQELIRWREEVICHVFGQAPDAPLLEANRRYFRQHVADGTHFSLVAEAEGEGCGCGSVCFSDELPSPDNPKGRCAYLMNIYVREKFRNRGIAHKIVRGLIAEARKRGCQKIYLETTADGKPVYASLGFRDMPDMMKYFHDHDTYV